LDILRLDILRFSFAETVSIRQWFGCTLKGTSSKGTNLIILVRYQRVPNAAAGPLADAPQSGEVNRNFRLLSQTLK